MKKKSVWSGLRQVQYLTYQLVRNWMKNVTRPFSHCVEFKRKQWRKSCSWYSSLFRCHAGAKAPLEERKTGWASSMFILISLTLKRSNFLLNNGTVVSLLNSPKKSTSAPALTPRPPSTATQPFTVITQADRVVAVAFAAGLVKVVVRAPTTVSTLAAAFALDFVVVSTTVASPLPSSGRRLHQDWGR